jgi:hypothetical protein
VLSPAQPSGPLTIPASGLTSGTDYTFQIKAINAAGSSSESTGVSAKFTMPPLPPTISSVNGTSATRESPTVSISFTQTPSDSTITNYSYSTDGTTYTALSPLNTSSPLTIPASGLTSGSNYTFQIKAINLAGSSSASTGVSAKFTMPPVAPTITTITASGQTVTIHFTQIPTDTTITDYQYSYSTNNGTSYLPFTSLNSTLSVNRESLLITQLESNLTYLFKIRANNGTYSDPSNSVEIRLRPTLQSLINLNSSVTLTDMLNYDYSLQEIKDGGFKGDAPKTAFELLTSLSFFSPPVINLSNSISFSGTNTLANSSSQSMRLTNIGSQPLCISSKE